MVRDRILTLLAALAAILTPVLAWAQSEPAGAGWDVFATIYVAGFALLAGAASWAVAKLVAYLKALEEKAAAEGKTLRWQGFLARFVTRVSVAGEKIGAKWRDLMAEAQREDSDGGKVITKAEREHARAEIKKYVIATYGSWDALVREGGEILGSGLEDFVNVHVSAEVDKQVAKTTANPPSPGQG